MSVIFRWAVATALGLMCGTARGQLLFSETFDYAAGGLVTNAAGAWVSTSGAADTAICRDGQLDLFYGRAEDVAAVLPGGPYRPGEAVTALYASFRVKFTVRPAALGTYFAHWTGESLLAQRGRIWAAATGVDGYGADERSFYVGIGNGRPSTVEPRGPGSGQVPVPLTTNVWYTLVTRYDFVTGHASLWVDPESEAERASEADDPVGEVISVGHFSFRQAAGMGGLRVDDVRVGTTFAAVAGRDTAPMVSRISTQETEAGVCVGPLDFRVVDAETAAEWLEVSVTSLTPELLGEGGLLLGGAGENREITVCPRAGAQGTGRVVVRAWDGGNETRSEFVVRVGYPRISPIADQVLSGTNRSCRVGFRVEDGETAATALAVRVSVSDEGLLPPGSLVLGGSGEERVLWIDAPAERRGRVVVTVTVSDGECETSRSFEVTIGGGPGLLVEDSFEYERFSVPNALIAAEGSGWVSTSGTAGQVQVTNGWVYLDRSKTEDVALELPGGPFCASNAVVLYAGFPVRFGELPTVAGSYFLHLRNTESGIAFRARVFAGTTGEGTNCVRLGIGNGSTAAAFLPQDLKLGGVYWVVLRYNGVTGEAALWVDPVGEESAHIRATDPAGGAECMGWLGLRQASGIGRLALGHLRVGTSFQDVRAGEVGRIGVRREGLRIWLEWSDPGMVLVRAERPQGPFLEVPGARSPQSLDPSGAAGFYRIMRR